MLTENSTVYGLAFDLPVDKTFPSVATLQITVQTEVIYNTWEAVLALALGCSLPSI